MCNKENTDGSMSSRPCFLAFADNKYSDIYWLVPISSKVEKYKEEEKRKIAKYGRCNTICFGTVLGREAAFLIQNMCPVTIKYITPYLNRQKCPIKIDNRTSNMVIDNAKKVLGMINRGIRIVFPDVKTIYNSLVDQLTNEMATKEQVMPVKNEKEKTKSRYRDSDR